MLKIDSNALLSPDHLSEIESRNKEIESFKQLENQEGTSIPALFSQYYKFIQNPSSVSIETYKRMVDTDETIGAGVDFLATCLAARLGEYQHESQEISDWVNKALAKLENGFFNWTKEFFSACWAGFYVGEKVWENSEDGFIVSKIVSLPPSTVLFEVNKDGSLTEDGILQYQRNWNPLAISQGLGFFGGASTFGWGAGSLGSKPDPLAKLGDMPFPLRTANSFSYLSVRIPKLKCIHYAFDAQGKFGNPYGRSLLRRIYKYYVQKDAYLQMLAIALDRKGTPLTIVYADNNTTLIDPDKAPDGANARGRDVGMRADVAARKAFKNVHNDSTIILPGKKGQIFDMESFQQGSNNDAFIQSIQMCNQSMLRGLLIPSLIFSAGDGAGSFALGQEHSKTWEKILDGTLSGGKQKLIQEYVRELICYNFPESAWKKDGFGDFGRRELTQDERQKELTALEQAVSIGCVDMNDLNDLNIARDKAGFPARESIIVREDLMGEDDGGNDDGDNGDEEEADKGSDGGGPPKGKGKPGKPGKSGKGKSDASGAKNED